MIDVFISYKKEDLSRVEPIARALAQAGYKVWWDHRIPPGRTYRDVIGAALQSAKCVVVVWSKLSTGAQWVLDEADEGKKRGVLLPLIIDAVDIPYGFRQIEAARLIGWNGAASHPEWRDALEAVGNMVGRRPGGPPQPFAAAAPITAPKRERASGGGAGGLLGVLLISAILVGGGYYAWSSGLIDQPRATENAAPPAQAEASTQNAAPDAQPGDQARTTETPAPQQDASAGSNTPAAPPPAAPPPTTFTGVWNTQATFGGLSFRHTMTLTQNGANVSGAYQQVGGSITGQLHGTVQGRVLNYTWSSIDGAGGSGVFNLAADGSSFSGPVTFSSGNINGAWEGRRQ